jgi:hypothetical protein
MLDDLTFGERDERGMNREFLASLDARTGSQVGHRLKRLDELRPAVGIAAVIESVGAEEDVRRAEHFGPA